MDQDGEVHYYTNLKDDFTDKKLDEITRQFEEYGRYLCYNADRAELLTDRPRHFCRSGFNLYEF